MKLNKLALVKNTRNIIKFQVTEKDLKNSRQTEMKIMLKQLL